MMFMRVPPGTAPIWGGHPQYGGALRLRSYLGGAPPFRRFPHEAVAIIAVHHRCTDNPKATCA